MISFYRRRGRLLESDTEVIPFVAGLVFSQEGFSSLFWLLPSLFSFQTKKTVKSYKKFNNYGSSQAKFRHFFFLIMAPLKKQELPASWLYAIFCRIRQLRHRKTQETNKNINLPTPKIWWKKWVSQWRAKKCSSQPPTSSQPILTHPTPTTDATHAQ